VLVNSMFTVALVVGLAVPELTLGTTVANLGFSRIDFPAPVFIGDTIHVVTDVIDARPSRSRPGTGIVTFEHRGINQRAETVCLAVRAAMMHARPATERS
jgi:acyl dehydratase